MYDKLQAYTEAAVELVSDQPNYAIKTRLNDDDSISVVEWGDGVTPPSDSDLTVKADAIFAAYPMKSLRKTRNELLAESDWSQGADVPDAIKTKWQSYRQTLRDLPSNQTPSDSSLSNITWPTKPS
tara:strand:+ start:1005 stop:1382 length:378 start_codon:yes stop_codon:yes gene_type:complete